MVTRGNRDSDEHQFGGTWTDQKLEVLRRYLSAYSTALKNKPFQKLYVDAFAGTGSRIDGNTQTTRSMPLYDDDDLIALKKGSARVALECEPPFHEYWFIEKDPNRCIQLENLKNDFIERATHIQVIQGDANEELRKLCEGDWKSKRAVVFLDPYGVVVKWDTVRAIAETKSIDLWILFPLAMGVGRMVTNSGEIPDSWREKLNVVFGNEEWSNQFYKDTTSPGLFGPEPNTEKAPMEEIGRYYNQQLATIFEGVAPNPAILHNSRRSPLYILCFAVGNPRGKALALRLAKHILEGING